MNDPFTDAGRSDAVREAHRRQADQCRREIHGQLGLLENQMAVYWSALAQYTKRNLVAQARRIERELQACSRERNKLLGILAALDHRFPAHDEQSTTGPRELAV